MKRIITAFLLVSSLTIHAQVSESDSLALVAFYNSTDGDNWTNNDNWLTGRVGTWYGVAIVDGRVSEINSLSNNLNGSIPAEIGDLTNLEILDLRGNANLTGGIPSEMVDLVNLKELLISGSFSFFSGYPEVVNNLTSLEVLDLHYNGIDGEIPNSIGNLINLKKLALWSNELSGSIPTSIGNLTFLEELFLDQNELSGNIPSEIGDLSNLVKLGLTFNELNGSIPTELGQLSNLTQLSLKFNKLSGSIPVELGNLSNILEFNLYGNNLTGSIPSELEGINNVNLSSLHLGDNQLTGMIPTEFGNLTFLNRLNINDNQLEGAIPNALTGLTELTLLEIENNNFTDLPDFSSNESLEIRNVSNNVFTFEDLEPNASLIVTNTGQQSFGDVQVFSLDGGENLFLDTNLPGSGTNDSYQWKKDGIDIVDATSETLEIENLSNGDIGVYTLSITNSLFPEITLESKSIVLEAAANIVSTFPYYEDFEDGNGGFASGGTNSSWELGEPVTENLNGAHSGVNAWVTNLDGDFNQYEESYVLSPVYDFTSMNEDVFFSFALNQSLSNTCCGEFFMEISYDGGNTYELLGTPSILGWYNDDRGFTGSTEEFRKYGLELEGSAGNVVRLRFNFSYLYSSTYEGVSFDDVSIQAQENLNDLFIADITVPEISLSLTEAEDIEVQVSNRGGSAQNLETLVIRVTNPDGTFVESSHEVGQMLSPGDTATLNYLGLLDFSNTGNYTIEVAIDNTVSDDIEANDSDVKQTGKIPVSKTGLPYYEDLEYESINEYQESVAEVVGLNGVSFKTQEGFLNLNHSFEDGFDATIYNESDTDFTELVFTLDLSSYDATLDQIGVIAKIESTPSNHPDNLILVRGNSDNDWLPLFDYQTLESSEPQTVYLNNVSQVLIDNGQQYGETFQLSVRRGSAFSSIRLYDLFIDVDIVNESPEGTLEQDSLALVALYNSTEGDNWTTNDNWLIGNLDTWFGVTIQNERVTKLELKTKIGLLEGINAVGNIPPEIGDLKALEILNLFDNSISGSIPVEIGELTNLKELNLSRNNLAGSIPSELGELRYLRVLDFASNQLSGEIPVELMNLSSLSTFSLSNNSLNGTIPTEIGNLKNLNSLSLNNNSLIGEIPSSIGNLSLSGNLYLSSNKLTGSIPPELGNLSNVEGIFLHNNDLTGTIPIELGSLKELEYLFLYSNELSGPIPPELGGLSKLYWLSLKGNNLSGTIPIELHKLDALVVLSLNSNLLSGSIPSEFNGMEQVVWIDLSNNQLSGPIPDELGSTPKLYALYLYNNELTGEIPSSLGNLDLQWLRLNNNNLEGTIPEELANCVNLKDFRLSNNLLDGEIPASFSSLTKMSDLYLGNNAFTGNIPEFFGEYTSLDTLNISNNQFTGSLPASLSTLTNVSSINIRENKFTELPDLTSLSSLDHFDVSWNYLSQEHIDINNSVITINEGQYGNPIVLNEIQDKEYTEGFQNEEVSILDVFLDADGDELSYTVSSSDELIATVSEVAGTLTITEQGIGTTTITVTADDGNEGSVSDEFNVTIVEAPNNAPVVANAIADQEYTEGFESADISLLDVFSDTDGDELSYFVSSSDELIATVSEATSTLTITEQGIGTATITVTADDGNGGSASDEFAVTINEAPNNVPIVANAIADQEYTEGFESSNISLQDVFSDPDGDELSYTISSSDELVATVSEAEGTLTITEVGIGTTTVTVTTDDGDGGSVSDEFAVTINEAPNNAPVVANAITDQEFTEGFESEDISILEVFSDADADELNYTVSSSDELIATVSEVAGTLTITEQGIGTATITVTADDSHGGSVSDEFAVTINEAPNNEPVVANAITDQEYTEGFERADISLQDVFSDTDGDELSYTVSSSDELVATISEAEGTVTITEVGIGNATITVTADDGNEGSVSDEFNVTIVEAPNNAPVVANAITDQEYTEGFERADISLQDVFSDTDGDELSYTVSSSDELVATVSEVDDILTITETGLGTATITVTADDGNGGSASDEFAVTINEAPNNVPIVANAIADQEYTEGFESADISLLDVFSDADGDELSYFVSSSDELVATISEAEGTVTITEVGIGNATITVTADDGNEGSVSDEFNVTIVEAPNNAPVVANAITDQEYTEGFERADISLQDVFSDTDGDELSYTVSSSDELVATVSEVDDILTITETGLGIVTITVTADDGNVGSVSDEFTVIVSESPLSVSEYQVEIFPNPTNGSVFINLPSISTDIQVKVIDLSGRNIPFTSISNSANLLELSFPDNVKGLILIDITDGSGKHYKHRVLRK